MNQSKLYCLCFLVLSVLPSALHAQIFTAPLQASTTGTNPVDFEFRADGTMIATGNAGVGTLLSSDQGAGTRLLWFPDLGAFRAGTVTGTDWNSSNLGVDSIALGVDVVANGTAAVALGSNNTSAGTASFCAGEGNYANGDSVALGLDCNASSWGGQAVAIGQYSHAGYEASAIGCQSDAPANWSFAAAGGTANGSHGVAMGLWTVCTGEGAVAIGHGATAVGGESCALNAGYAESYFSTAVGYGNIGGGNTSSWIATDPLFEVGNGASGTPSDALVVYKNGNVTAQGVISAAQGGDIPMYQGN